MRAIFLSFFLSALCFAANPANALSGSVGWSDCSQRLPCWSGPFDFGSVELGETKTVDLTYVAGAFEGGYEWAVNPRRLGYPGDDAVSAREVTTLRQVKGYITDPLRDIVDVVGWNILETSDGWRISITNTGSYGLGPIQLVWDATGDVDGFVTFTDGSERWVGGQNLFLERSLVTWTPGSSAVVPLPAALPLFATVLAGVGFLGWCRKRQGFNSLSYDKTV